MRTGVLEDVQVPCREHPGVGDDDHVCDTVAFLEGFQNGDEGGRFCLVPLEQVHFQRDPPGSTRSPTCTCGSTRCSLLIPTLRSASSSSFSK